MGDQLLGPGWSTFAARLEYQVFDVTDYICTDSELNAIGVRVAEGWFCGLLRWGEGIQTVWGERPALLAQIEIWYTDCMCDVVKSDSSWTVCRGPTVLAEIYNDEKYAARLEVTGWSLPLTDDASSFATWESVTDQGFIQYSTQLIAQEAAPVRKVPAIKPISKVLTPSRKTVVDFAQNLVGFTRLKHIRGSIGHKLAFSHAEILEKGELSRRTLRSADNVDTYTKKGR